MGLGLGCNQMEFRLDGAVLAANLWLVERGARVAVCDVDGTVTRADVGGQLFPLLTRRPYNQPNIDSVLHSFAVRTPGQRLSRALSLGFSKF